MGFPCGSVGKESTCNAGDLGSLPGLERFPGEGQGYPLQYSVLKNSMNYWIHGVTKNRTQLSDFKKNKKTIKLSVSHSIQFSCSVVSNSLQPHRLQHARPPCPSPTPGVYSNTWPLSLWCHPTTSSSVVPFSCLQSFPALGSFQMSQFFSSGGQMIGVSASALVLPMNIQDWFPLGLTGLIFLQSKGLSRVFSNTTVQKRQFFGTQLSSRSNFHIHPWLLEKP